MSNIYAAVVAANDNDLYSIASWTELGNKVHRINQLKGFWPPEGRSFGEYIALCHSEISEADEGWIERAPDAKVPQYLNTYVEIADCMIRILDAVPIFNLELDTWNVDDYILGRDARNPENEVEYAVCEAFPLSKNLMVVNIFLSRALEADRKGQSEDVASYLEDAFMACYAILLEYEQPAFDIVVAKVAYNETRPFKHGKKY